MNKAEQQQQVRLAVIGLGGRGRSLLGNLLEMEDVQIAAVCDLYEDRRQLGSDQVEASVGRKPAVYADYKELLAREQLDGVVIASSWSSHSEIALASMKAGIYTAVEAGGAASVEECWELVRTSEETGMPCMMLENCCYGREEMALLHMIRQGLFGELIHCQGGYEHDLREEVAMGLDKRHYRVHHYLHRDGEIYPTHGIGPIAKYLNINRGNRFVALTSMSSKARGLKEWIAANLDASHPLADKEFAQGDIVTTMLKTSKGETVLLVHDTTLPRPYSRNGRVQGTKGIWLEDNKSIHLMGQSPEHQWESFDGYLTKHEHPLWEEYIRLGVRGGHGGMDYLVLRAFVESVAAQTTPPIDVYDTAVWMAVTALSEQSIAQGSQPVAFPDFTNGKWTHREQAPAGKYSLETVDPSLF
ncbi:alpha-N-acetylgalactosaminidase [Paenibacillus sp. J31TS4]|uniref:Gfo/Idh/MocA family protein n=1 Tax=Paenibacillus sp. J31TS4 TaxID=2807195 RepID=UPI001B124485|nr:Gfo/Idh/MocA family oxidoreductase [Paenibacillus sp. J31TS4]GIP37130.1 alpha-N-acetylgalactosaminidase [Paenibacillus sp. J31TS4]